ncbi:hypothetical protein [Paracoccus mutanolyticus]|uniref:hypothetical protein n=1 Tax=Paracoccus mutanolyticus TaxID=1499308 RepID=UPI001678C4B1|nr:hypothetical protein [Paracoccus mutanolyticus]
MLDGAGGFSSHSRTVSQAVIIRRSHWACRGASALPGAATVGGDGGQRLHRPQLEAA